MIEDDIKKLKENVTDINLDIKHIKDKIEMIIDYLDCECVVIKKKSKNDPLLECCNILRKKRRR